MSSRDKEFKVQRLEQETPSIQPRNRTPKDSDDGPDGGPVDTILGNITELETWCYAKEKGEEHRLSSMDAGFLVISTSKLIPMIEDEKLRASTRVLLDLVVMRCIIILETKCL